MGDGYFRGDTPMRPHARLADGEMGVGGGCGIRTHEDIAALPVFKTSAIGH